MQVFATERLRNVVLLSHSGAGKTSLGEALLFASGAISRMGRVEDGNTVSDYEPEEVKRRGSIQMALLPCVWKGYKVNLLDTPGFFDFYGEVHSALRVVEGAVLVVSAPTGVEVGTEFLWRMARERGLPILVFVNKMDRENADFFRALEGLRSTFGRQFAPLQVPVGSAGDFQGVVPLLPLPQEVPGVVREAVERAREELVEAVAETDDDLAVKYLEGEGLSDEELWEGLKRAVRGGQLVPVLCGSAVKGIGVQELLDAILGLLPSPAEVGPARARTPEGEGEVALAADPGGALAALVFKTAADPYVGRLSFIRVYSGTLQSDSVVWNAVKGQQERIGQLFAPRGKAQDPVPSLPAGDIGAVAKLAATQTGDTLTARENPLILPPVEFPEPKFTMAVYPKGKADLDKLLPSLQRLVEEDPSLRIRREPDTGEMLLEGLGDTHLETAIQRAQRKFGVNLELRVPRVPYKETISGRVQVEHKYKQQTGGHGHYAHVFLRLEPLPRGSGVQFADEIVGGRVPREFIPYVEKGVRRACEEGVLAGYPIVDIKVTLYDGSYHVVDSAGMDFDIAGYFGLKKGVQQDAPILLEPIVYLKVTVPDAYTGDVIGDLNGKRGRILGMTPHGDGTTTIEAHVPLAEVQRYALDLRSMTQARGQFTMAFDHYEEVPPHLAQRIIEQAKREKAEAKA